MRSLQLFNRLNALRHHPNWLTSNLFKILQNQHRLSPSYIHTHNKYTHISYIFCLIFFLNIKIFAQFKFVKMKQFYSIFGKPWTALTAFMCVCVSLLTFKCHCIIQKSKNQKKNQKQTKIIIVVQNKFQLCVCVKKRKKNQTENKIKNNHQTKKKQQNNHLRKRDKNDKPKKIKQFIRKQQMLSLTSVNSSTLTPMHLRKAKLMFFWVRYPSSAVLKMYFPDIKFNKNNTAQLVKWFSNFR